MSKKKLEHGIIFKRVSFIAVAGFPAFARIGQAQLAKNVSGGIDRQKTFLARGRKHLEFYLSSSMK